MKVVFLVLGLSFSVSGFADDCSRTSSNIAECCSVAVTGVANPKDPTSAPTPDSTSESTVAPAKK